MQPAFEACDGGAEVVVESQLQVDVVPIPLAREAVGEIVAWVHGDEHLAAHWIDPHDVHLVRRGQPGGVGDGSGESDNEHVLR